MDILIAILTISGLVMLLGLAGKGVGSVFGMLFSAPKPKPLEEYPYEHVRLIMDTDNSGRFKASAHRCKETGIYEALVTTRNDDVYVGMKTVTAATKEELEYKVMDAYEEMAEERKEEVKLRRLVNQKLNSGKDKKKK